MLLRDISALHRMGFLYYQKQLREEGLSGGDCLCMIVLRDNKRINQDGIAEILMMDKGAITKVLSKLEERGLVQRTLNPNNKREKITSLTSRGEALLDRITQVQRSWYWGILEGFTEEEQMTFRALTERAAQNAGRIMDRTGAWDSGRDAVEIDRDIEGRE